MSYKKPKAKGYYWVLLHPIFEMSWTVGFFDGSNWFVVGLEGTKDEYLINEVGERLKDNPEKINYT